MALNDFLEISIGDEIVDVKGDTALVISYKIEDKEDFTSKKGSSALSVIVPPTLNNTRISNTFNNSSISDLTSGKLYRGIRKAVIKFKGVEFLVGKAFLKKAKHLTRPSGFEYDFYGNNSDWVIDLQQKTFFDYLSHITIPFTKQHVIDSWQFDGTNEALPYVFGPIRYANGMESSTTAGITIDDYNMLPEYMKPSISKYWLIFWAFRSIGYTLRSEFFNTSFFRRQVMPWTWGSFLFSDGTRQEVLKFLAIGTKSFFFRDNTVGYVDLDVSNDFYNGGFDTSNTYKYANMEGSWQYPLNIDFGAISTTFKLSLDISSTCRADSNSWGWVQWFKNGVQQKEVKFSDLSHSGLGRADYVAITDYYETFDVGPGDIISFKIRLDVSRADFISSANMQLAVLEFSYQYSRIILGSNIDFTTFLGLKNFQFLDFLGGVIDEYDLTINTDPITKTVYMEPTHPYAIGTDLTKASGGYYDGTWLDWSDKHDLSKESEIESFTDSEQHLLFKYKDDGGDGTLKKIQDGTSTVVGQAKYVFPDRFMTGVKTITNRFFAPTMHYIVKQWQTATRNAPQMIIMVPENISNTSKGEAQNTFQPKSVYYKGLTTDYRWIFDNEDWHGYPQMFAVNYMPGGEADPILSYSDEKINNVVGFGLLRRFFLQRLSIMANGEYYTTWFKLNNNDVSNFLHREFIVCNGQRWELIQLDFKPLKNESTQCVLKKWSPIEHG